MQNSISGYLTLFSFSLIDYKKKLHHQDMFFCKEGVNVIIRFMLFVCVCVFLVCVLNI